MLGPSPCDANDRLLTELLNNDANPDIDRTTTYAYTGTQQTGKTVSGDVSETHVYQYDVRGRMSQTAVTKSGSTTTNTYKYNADGIRVGMTEQVGTGGVITTVFHIDPYNHTGFAQVLEEGVDSNVYIPADGRLQSNEISLAYALGHDVIEQGAGSGVTSRFYLYDGHGSTRGLMNFAATVLQRYAYDAYGNQLAFGNLTPAASASTRFLFSGERSDKATGLQYRRERYYDSLTARFTTDDPFSGLTNDPQTLHKYTFVHGDPVNFDDPSGLYGVGGFGGFGAALGFSVRFALIAFNAYGFITNTVSTFNNISYARLSFAEGDIWGGIGYSGMAVVHAGLAGLSAFGLKVGFTQPPPVDFSGGFALVGGITSGGAAAPRLIWQAIHVNPAFAEWIYTQLVPAVLSNLGNTVLMAAAGSGGLPVQEHHFASNKHPSKYTPLFEEIANKYGLKLDGAWNKKFLPQNGRHPNLYHEFVLENMKMAQKEAGASVQRFLELFDKYVKQPVSAQPEMLRKPYWEP